MADRSKFQVEELSPTVVVLRCTGGLSWEDREVLATHVHHHLQAHPEIRGLIVDLAALEFINSAGLGALLQLNRSTGSHQVRLAIAGVPPLLKRVCRAVGLHRVVPHYDDVPAALAALEESPVRKTATPQY